MTSHPDGLRVFVIDDHPAMRTGIGALLDGERGLHVVGCAASHDGDLSLRLADARPAVVLLDPDDVGALRLCRRLKSTAHTPAVLLYAADADAELVLPAVLAGADGLLGKAESADRLVAAIWAVAGGARVLPEVPVALRRRAASELEPVDLPVLSMVLDGTTPEEAADTLRVSPAHVARRLDAMIGRLRPSERRVARTAKPSASTPALT
jgi:DNA-binding NarL/FixJ family response regulator